MIRPNPTSAPDSGQIADTGDGPESEKPDPASSVPASAASARTGEIELARRLLDNIHEATFATAFAGTRPADEGWPYASLVLVALDGRRNPVLLLSDLAEHTRNLKADPRMSLLLDGTAGHEDRLAAPRLTLLGRAAIVGDAGARADLRGRFLARHPAAATYVDFGDFNFYRVTLERAHLVAGFGRIRWIEAAALLA